MSYEKVWYKLIYIQCHISTMTYAAQWREDGDFEFYGQGYSRVFSKDSTNGALVIKLKTVAVVLTNMHCQGITFDAETVDGILNYVVTYPY